MAVSISLLTFIVAVSVPLVGFGAQKLYRSFIAGRGKALPSLSSLSHMHSSSAYPEDYYPGGHYAELTFGETHYFRFGPENGKKIVFVHGLSIPTSVYKKVARHMADNGCHVLLYDLYSRGYSVGPAKDHDPFLYVTQLMELLQHVQWDRCNFVGLSLGGGIVACFAQQFPDVVESATFIAPGGLLLPSEMPWVAKLFLLPYTEDICNHKAIRNYFSKKNIESLRNEFKNEKHVPASVEEAAEILDLQFRYHPGYARGLMLTLKKFPFSGLFPQFASLQDHTFPVQVIWGTRDKVVPGTTVETLQKLVPRIKVTKVEGATHSIVMTHPETIIKQLEGFVC